MNFNRVFAVAVLAFIVASGSASAQVKRKPSPSPKQKPVPLARQISGDLLPVDKQVIIGKLPNGLTYYIRHNEQPKNRAELYLVNKAGSILETDAQQGLAHFTEHMAFNGTRDFPKTCKDPALGLVQILTLTPLLMKPFTSYQYQQTVLRFLKRVLTF
jgi:zinc protease